MGAKEIKKKMKKNYAVIPFSQRQINFEKDLKIFQEEIIPNIDYKLNDNLNPTEKELNDITLNNLALAKESGIQDCHQVFLYYLCQRFVENFVVHSNYNIFNTLNDIMNKIELSTEDRESLENTEKRFQKEFSIDLNIVTINLNSRRYKTLSMIHFIGINANLKFNKNSQPEVFNLIIDDNLLENNNLVRDISDVISNSQTLLVVNYILYPRDIDNKLSQDFGLDGQTYQSLYALIHAVTINRKIKSFVLHSMKDYNINLAPEICRLIEKKLQSETLISFHLGNLNLTGKYKKNIEFLLSCTKSLLFMSYENKYFTKEDVINFKNIIISKNRSIMALSVVTPIFNGMKKSVITKMKEPPETDNKDSKLEFIYFSHKSLINLQWLNQQI